MFNSRGKLLVNLALQKPEKGFLEYKQKEYIDTSGLSINVGNRMPPRKKKNFINESEEEYDEDNPYYSCYSDREW